VLDRVLSINLNKKMHQKQKGTWTAKVAKDSPAIPYHLI
jgi:hypothetical protein